MNSMDAIEFAQSVIGELTQDRDIARSYPWLLVNREIVSPSELIALSDDELRARWEQYDTPNRMGVVSTVWSCRGYARQAGHADETWIPYPYPQYPKSFADTSPIPVVLFWPPRWNGAPLEYIAHWGDLNATVDALAWLIHQPLPVFNAPRAYLLISSGGKPFEPKLIPMGER